MPKFRKKPIIIVAEQWWPGTYVKGVNELVFDDDGLTVSTKRGVVVTKEGPLFVKAGDWIITGIDGEKYPIDNDIFIKTYEPID